MRSIRRNLVLLLVLAAAVLGAAGPADAVSPVVIDCNAHSKLTRQYSIAELRDALAHIPADVAEYTNCSDVIRTQMLAQLAGKSVGGAGSGHGSGGSFLSTGVIVALVIVVAGGGALVVVAARRRGR